MLSRLPFTSAFLVLSQVSILIMSQLHPALVLSSILVGLAQFKRRSRRFSGRQWLGLVIALALIDLIFSRVNQASGYLIGPGTLTIALFLNCLLAVSIVVEFERPYRQIPTVLAAFLLIVSTMSAHLSLVLPLSCLALLLLAGALREQSELKLTFEQLLWLVPVAILGIGIASFALWSETRLAMILGFFSFIPVSGIQLPPVSTLNSLQKWHASDVVVFRVYGERPPMYLNGRTFELFEEAQSWRWKTTKDLISADRLKEPERPGVGRPEYLFPNSGFPVPEDLPVPVRLEYPSAGQGFTLYTPRNFGALGCELDQLHRYSDAMLQIRASDRFSGVYNLYPTELGWYRDGSLDTLSEEEFEACLQLPERLSPLVPSLARKVTTNSNSDLERAEAITNFLQEEFEYGYAYPFSSDKNALHEFLQDRPPAHCEFFATSAALMLRSLGIPTRYINGFVIQERSLSRDYYVVRLKHAHAWIEAFIPGHGWLPFDPTPPDALSSADDPTTFWKAFAENMQHKIRRFFNLFRGSPREILAKISAAVRELFQDETYLRGALFLVISVLLIGLLSRVLRFRKRPKPSPGEGWERSTLTPLLESIEDLLPASERRLGPHETLREWRGRLNSTDALPDDSLELLTRFVQLFEQCRYSITMDPELRDSLTQDLTALCSELRGNLQETRERGPSERPDGK